MTDVRPMIAPTLMVLANHAHCGPKASTATATGSGTLSEV